MGAVVAWPVWPQVPAPQQLTCPLSTITHVCCAPVATREAMASGAPSPPSAGSAATGGAVVVSVAPAIASTATNARPNDVSVRDMWFPLVHPV